MENKLLIKAIKKELRKWEKWKDVYQFKGRPEKNPLLKDPKKFMRFMNSYSVARNISKGKHEKFRRVLLKSSLLKSALKDGSGIKLEKLNEDLSKEFSSHKSERGLTSVLSKIAAFLNPDLFVAFDQYAKKGINRTLGIYPGYLAALNLALGSGVGDEILKEINKMKLKGVLRKTRFTRRVLDGYLMELGRK